MITPSYGLTATERVLPRLALDFTTASLDPRVAFTRTGNTATVVDSSGYVAPINADLPRFDYDPITLACKGLLIEEARTNLLLQSQTFQTSWTATLCTVGVNAENAPDGLLTADKLIANIGETVSNTAASVALRQDITKAASATTYTYTIFAKQSEFNGIRLFVRDGASSANNAVVTFSLVNGSIAVAAAAAGTFTNASASAGTLYANGFYRFSLTFTTGTETTIRILAIPANSTATTGDGVKGIFVWGAQLEAGTFPTSYIPTVATSVTRNADVATMTGTNFSDWFNASEGAFVWWGSTIPLTDTAAAYPMFSASDGTLSNQIQLIRRDTTTSDRRARAQIDYLGATGEGIIDSANGVFTGNTLHKAAIAYKLDNMGFGFDGSFIGSDTAVRIPTVTQMSIGTNGNATAFMNGHTQKLMYYPQRLTNAELTAFSK
jgi:hypothetical protein